MWSLISKCELQKFIDNLLLWNIEMPFGGMFKKQHMHKQRNIWIFESVISTEIALKVLKL